MMQQQAKFLTCLQTSLSFITLILMTSCGGGGDSSPSINSATGSSVSPTVSLAVCTVSLPTKGIIAYDSTNLREVCGNIYVDPTAPKTVDQDLIRTYQEAITVNREFYGAITTSDPDIVACNYNTSNCANYFAGATLRNRILPPGYRINNFVANRWTVILISASYSGNSRITAHELSHQELAQRLGGKNVPAWFNEGLATHIGNEPNCTNIAVKGVNDLTTLSTSAAWEAHTNQPNLAIPTYCQAAAEVRTWIGRNGKPALLKLIDEVKSGKSFDLAYGALLAR